jgi:hypothetical protein
MLDMIRPASKHAITLADLKHCKMTPVFFDTFFNLEKYLDHEQRDPFATQRETDEEGNEVTKRTLWPPLSPLSPSDVGLGPVRRRGVRVAGGGGGERRAYGRHVSGPILIRQVLSLSASMRPHCNALG